MGKWWSLRREPLSSPVLEVKFDAVAAVEGDVVILTAEKCLRLEQRAELSAWLEQQQERTGLKFIVLDGFPWKVTVVRSANAEARFSVPAREAELLARARFAAEPYVRGKKAEG